MKKKHSRFHKAVDLTLAPAEVGPICSYSPYCSPSDSDRNLAAWRIAHLTMHEDNLEDLSRDDEAALINTWVLQLIRRELTVYLQQAEEELGPLLTQLPVPAAEIISRAIELRANRLKLKPKRSKLKPKRPRR